MNYLLENYVFMIMLLESSRDNLLLPYFELLKSKGLELSFGQFKSILLEHLTKQGRLFNLSLSSNYYLAGAARYYFNGDLTENNDLALFYNYTINSARNNTEQNVTQNHVDVFKQDVCTKLNVLIKILRNAYIETIGTSFEQPEDFGELPLKKLLSKYNSKIKKELLNSGDEAPEEVDDLNTSTEVGNGYTFDIIYEQNDASKYYEATEPRAWCITYSQGNYDYYIREYNIHYVIFRKNGYENVERVPNKKMWIYNGNKPPKPQDEYGNSLIALLQSNNSWLPELITSRYNHGAGDTGDVNADHAYTTEEFMRITGVSEEDLKRIYQIWLKNSNRKNKTRVEANREKKETLLKLKEIQMRINGGENPLNLLEKRISIIEDTNKNARKSVFIASIRDTNICFVVDKCKIVFDTVVETTNCYKNFRFSNELENPTIKNIVVCNFETYCVVYDYRRHSILNIGGVYKFKAIPRSFENRVDSIFYEVKLSNKDIALVYTSTNTPLMLPNGQFWFNEIHVKSAFNSYYQHGNKVTAFFVGDKSTSIIEIVYDSSSREKYFYNLQTKNFIEIPEFNGTDEALFPKNGNNRKLEPIIVNEPLGRNLYSICYTNAPDSRWYKYCTPIQLYKTNGEKIFIDGSEYFSDIKYLGNNFVSVVKFKDDTEHRADSGCIPIEHYIYNVQTNKIYTLNGKNLTYVSINYSGQYSSRVDESRIVYFISGEKRPTPFGIYYRPTDYCYLFDKAVGKFVKNPYNFPSNEMFYKFSQGNEDGSGLVFFKSNDIDYENWEKSEFKISFPEGIIYEFERSLYSYEIEQGADEGRFNIRPIEYFE